MRSFGTSRRCFFFFCFLSLSKLFNLPRGASVDITLQPLLHYFRSFNLGWGGKMKSAFLIDVKSSQIPSCLKRKPSVCPQSCHPVSPLSALLSVLNSSRSTCSSSIIKPSQQTINFRFRPPPRVASFTYSAVLIPSL